TTAGGCERLHEMTVMAESTARQELRSAYMDASTSHWNWSHTPNIGAVQLPSAIMVQEPAQSKRAAIAGRPPSRCPKVYGFAGGGGAGWAGAPGVPKSTFGASRDSGLVAVKYFRSLAPVIFAVSTAGNLRMYALYCWTAVL